MTPSTLRTELDRLLYQHPLTETNVSGVEHLGADVHFETDGFEVALLRDEVADLRRVSDELQSLYDEAKGEIRKLERKLGESERALSRLQ